MGQSSSNPSTLPAVALHCLRVTDASPVAGQIEPFFDYLVGVDDEAFEEPHSLGRILKERQRGDGGGEALMSLKVYNAKSQRIRGMSRPVCTDVGYCRCLPGPKLRNADVPVHPGTLGLSLRACDPANALESVYHVLDVLEGSPAEVCLPRASLIS